MYHEKNAVSPLYTASKYPIRRNYTPSFLSSSDDTYIKPTHEEPALHKSSSSIPSSKQYTLKTSDSGLFINPSLTSTISRSTSARTLSKQHSSSKILLFHPSFQSPSYASRLENVRYVTVLYNPVSGNKRGEKVMLEAVAKFRAAGLEVNTIELKHAGHATEICSTKTDFDGIDVLCVIGGDGTFHEVVNGVMQNPIFLAAPHSLPALSVIPAGTGNSMVRELQGIASVRISIDEVLFAATVSIDILKVTILGPQAVQDTIGGGYGQDHLLSIAGKDYLKKEVIYAFNSIHWGLASRVLEKAEKLRWMGHGIRYTAASLMELLAGTSTHARIVLEDASGAITEYKNDSLCVMIANNIGTAGKGMKMAPKAKLNDGLIDLILVRSHKPRHLAQFFAKVYHGTHVDLPFVEYKQVRKFSIFPYKITGELGDTSNPQYAEELVDIDGELKGCTPFECEVIPHALKLII